MKFPRFLSKSLVATMLLTLQSSRVGAKPIAAAAGSGNAADALTFVYLHGFGGAKESPAFCQNLKEFLDGAGNDSVVVNYKWDSVKVDVLHAGASWIKAQENADAEAAKYKKDVIDELERKGSPYVLVGFSVGTRVILKALEASDRELKGLRGVYFLGSAMTKDTTLKHRKALPKGMKITNYHSPTHDKVHEMAFKFMSDIPAAGQLGFDDESVFVNYPVSCAHAHKGVGVHIDYSGLAEAIAFLELYKHGVSIAGRTKINVETRVGEGEVWWNTIRRLRVPGDGGRDGESFEVELEQHNMRPGYYRALRVGADGKRKRIARGENLHAILKELGLKPGEK